LFAQKDRETDEKPERIQWKDDTSALLDPPRNYIKNKSDRKRVSKMNKTK
jgi:hypothetical protein